MRFFVSGRDSVTVSGTAGYLSVNVSGGPYGDYYTLDVAAPPGQLLHPGYYPRAQRAPFRESGHPGLDIYGSGRGCNEVGGRFDVKDIKTGVGGAITRLWLTYEQHCENGTPALFGEIQIGMSAPAGGLLAVPSDTWWPDVAKGAAGNTVPMTFFDVGSGPITVSSAQVAGVAAKDFLVRSDECSGVTLQPGDGCQVYLRFVPTVAGPRIARLRLTTSTNLVKVQLDGFAIGGRTQLAMKSDPGDYIGQGLTYLYTPATDSIAVVGGRTHVGGGINAGDGSWWYYDFVPPAGDILTTGATYNATRYPFNGNGAGMDISGNGRGCNTLTGTFKVNSISVALDGTLRYVSISFVQHCEGSAPALHGTLDYRVPVGDVTPPGPVTNVSAVRNADGVHADVSWTKPGDPDFAFAIVRYLNAPFAPGTPNGSIFGFAGGGTSTSIKIPKQQPFTAAVYAVDTSGNVSAPVVVSFGP